MSRRVVDTAWRALRTVGSLAALALTAHSVVNLRAWRVPVDEPPRVRERVSVLLPVRDEERRVAPCLRALLEQAYLDDVEILVLDDASQDGTALSVRKIIGADSRARLLTGTELGVGWLGKPHACHQLARAARGSVLVFVDADVVLAPHAVAAAVHQLRSDGLQLTCPYPRQLAGSRAERLLQPLLPWSILTFLPVRAATSRRRSLAAANGQFLVVDAEWYRKAGGHASVRGAVLDDIALARSLKRAGAHGGISDGTSLAVCRMYDGWTSVRDGYAKSLWSAFGSAPRAAAVAAALVVVYVIPAAAALQGSAVGLAGYLAAVAGRYLVAERTGGRSLPDALAHPVSVLTFCWLLGFSLRRRRSGELSWRGRPVETAPPWRPRGDHLAMARP